MMIYLKPNLMCKVVFLALMTLVTADFNHNVPIQNQAAMEKFRMEKMLLARADTVSPAESPAAPVPEVPVAETPKPSVGIVKRYADGAAGGPAWRRETTA